VLIASINQNGTYLRSTFASTVFVRLEEANKMIEGCVADIVRQEPKGPSDSATALISVAKIPSAMSEGYIQISSNEHENRLVSRQYGSFVVVFEYGEEQNLIQIWTDGIALANIMTVYNGGSPNPLVQVAVGLDCLLSDLEELVSAVTGIKLSVKERRMVYELGREQTSIKEALKDILSSLSLEEEQMIDEEKRNLSHRDLEALWNVYRIALDKQQRGPERRMTPPQQETKILERGSSPLAFENKFDMTK
jgi:hypothetical protein